MGWDPERRFSARMLDVAEWLADRVDRLPAPTGERPAVVVQDPCHLRHVQCSHQHVRTVLAHVAEIVELDDDGLCCGAGGAYSALEPDLAADIRSRKVAAIDVVVRNVLGQQAAQMCLVEDDYVVEKLSPIRSRAPGYRGAAG